MTFDHDLRSLLFDGTSWYADLEESTPDYWVLWRVTKSSELAWWRELLIAAAAFARDHAVLEEFRRRLEGIRPASLSDSAGPANFRSSLSPIWEVVNELVVGLYLERAAGWTITEYEPAGHAGKKGEWECVSPTGSSVFVEVKTLVEPERTGTGVYMRGVASQRVTDVLKGAYRQLPKDSRATLVVVVGTGEILRIPFGIMHGDIFQTLFGRMQLTFSVMPYVEGSARLGPSFYDMFAHAGKHRRLGCVAGFQIGGMDTPGLGFYAIHNPFADENSRLKPEDFPGIRQFWVDSTGHGQEISGAHPDVHWQSIAETITSTS